MDPIACGMEPLNKTWSLILRSFIFDQEPTMSGIAPFMCPYGDLVGPDKQSFCKRSALQPALADRKMVMAREAAHIVLVACPFIGTFGRGWQLLQQRSANFAGGTKVCAEKQSLEAQGSSQNGNGYTLSYVLSDFPEAYVMCKFSVLVARAIRNAIRANRFARIIR